MNLLTAGETPLEISCAKLRRLQNLFDRCIEMRQQEEEIYTIVRTLLNNPPDLEVACVMSDHIEESEDRLEWIKIVMDHCSELMRKEEEWKEALIQDAMIVKP